ncbi:MULTISPECIES: M4 family metallopeptidase [unclassified Pseudomonas]|uniref:M4 family metallopeptidase n=1 Tax=unclassified Pseudomonas TaxID=196821 RepID=UPI000E0BC832|nr:MULTISPECIES: M4 family metallopeptidase [unclassified Pseudomonas]RDI01826.1 protealysin propeptide [Pseudomonas fluorescens]BBP54046.1 zinc metalloprotease [Pseudomonas sp. St386]
MIDSRPLHGFIPPYILNRIIAHGSEQQRSSALGTLTHVRSLRHNPGPPGNLPAAAKLPKPGKAGQPQRSVHDAQNTMELPGQPVRLEGQRASGDPAVDEAYDALGATYDFFWKVLGRDSIDNKGFALVGSVHYGQGYENAFWNGAQMVFGDGDGEIFQRFTRSLDVVAHELAHGVTESEAGLVYANQSGALNESISDVFGVLVKQFVLEQTADQADWLIGADLLTDKINGNGLRSMSNPGSAYDDPLLGKDPQPAHMREFVITREDNGGVHINSGIPNRAFYLVATTLGGFAWEKAGRIWYETLCDRRLANDASFSAFARLTVEHARQRFGTREVQAVQNGWAQVGVDLTQES